MFNTQYIFIFLLSLVFLFILIKLSKQINILDKPKNRSLHNISIPSSGGIAFIGVFFFYFILFDFNFLYQYFLMFISIFFIYVIGILDDIKNIKPKIKFMVILLSTLILYYEGIFIDSLGVYWGYDLKLGFLSIIFTIFAINGFTNALNLIDGLDGLASGISLIILSTFFYIGQVFNDDMIMLLSKITIVTLVSFIILNWNPAKIFMGDSGSLTLGFIISIIAILSLKYIHPGVILYFTAVPLIDTIIVLIRRIKSKRSPFKADKTHIHHILYDFFGTTKQTVIFLIMAQSIFCFLGYVVARHIEHYPDGLFPIAMLVSFIILVSMAYILFTTILKKEKGTYDNISK